MRIPVNLASEPFRRDRPVVVASTAGAAALGILLIVLVTLMVTGREHASAARADIERTEAQIRLLDAEQAKLDATLRRPQNAEVLERSLMLNTLIDRKAISWTRIFGDLETVMPYNVRLIYIRLPQVDAANLVTLDMVVAAQGTEPLQNLLKKLQESSMFGPPSVPSYMPPSQNEPLHRYRVSVNYAQKL